MFAVVHYKISHMNSITSNETIEIEQSIISYLDFFRQNIPGCVFPKLHFLEDHVLPWIVKYGFGMALHGEQVGEPAHREFNRLQHCARHIPNIKDQLLNMMTEQMIFTDPEIQGNIPKPLKRKLHFK